MEPAFAISRLASFNSHDVIEQLNDAFLEPYFPTNASISLLRRLFLSWLFFYITTLFTYFTFASIDYLYHAKFSHRSTHTVASVDVYREIRMSVYALGVMAILSAPIEIAVQFGYSKLYYRISQYGVLYLILSPVLFLVLSDAAFYFIHRALHHPLLYRHIHYAHHSFRRTSAFAAFALHPLDGFAQGVVYQLLLFIIPLHAGVHGAFLLFVMLWTVLLHDGKADLRVSPLNSAPNHALHHALLNYNFGQYTIIWDRLFHTFRDSRQHSSIVQTFSR